MSIALENNAFQAASFCSDQIDFATSYINSFSKQAARLTAFCIDRATAEEILQEAYAKAWGVRSSFQNDEHLQKWIFIVAKNLAFSVYRRQRPLADIENREFEDHSIQALAEKMSQEANLDLLEKALAAEANPVRAQVIQLHYRDGFKAREVAEKLCIPQNTVLSHLSRFRNSLRGSNK